MKVFMLLTNRNRKPRGRIGRSIKEKLACCMAVLGLIWSAPCHAATPTVLASGLNSPGNIMVDGSSVYWTEEPSGGVSGFPRKIGSISKTSNGGAAINYNYTGDPVYPLAGSSGGNDFVLDNGFIYYIGLSFDGTYNYPSICKVPKTGGASSIISPGAIQNNALTLGPVGGVLYYESSHQAPNDRDDTFNTVVSLSTLGGSESILTYSSYGWGAGGNYTINGTTWYYGLAALQYDKSKNDSFSYCSTNHPASLSTDNTYLYWSDGTAIWRMPLGGGDATILVSASHIYSIATPTTGAAAGSLFWVAAYVAATFACPPMSGLLFSSAAYVH